MSLYGHLRTLSGYVSRRLRRIDLPAAKPWAAAVADELRGSVRLTGELRRGERPQGVVILHGLGGRSDSTYVRAVAAVAGARGLTTLLPNLRGADRLGEDFYHAGLTVDLRAAVESPALAECETVFVVGFSLGGHLALRYLVEGASPRVDGVVAICPPLDLAACCDGIDRPAGALYRRYLLGKLMEIYRAVAARRPVPLPVEEAARIRSQREFDDRVIAARHGFDGVEDYYGTTSVGPELGAIEGRALLVLAKDDPMIPAASLEPYLDGLPSSVETRWARGGHVAFPKRLDLGEPGPSGLEEQVLSWLLRRPEESARAVSAAC